MALDQKFFKKSTAGSTDQEQGLVLHLDANDVDSYDGDGSIWYDITSHDVSVPLTDNDDNLEIHIDASNTNSYPGYGSTITDISTNGYSFSPHGNATFGSDTRGYFTLDGSDDDLRTTNAVTGFSGDLTFEWWFNASESNNFALLHANPASNDSGINGIFIGNAGSPAGAIEIYRKTTGGTLHSGATSSTGLSGMASDGWVHFVITITSANVCKFYKDGSYTGTLTLNGNGTNHDTYNFVSIGGYNNASYEFAGKIGCFRMYSEILTASDIGQNYRAGNFLNYSSIITSKHEATQGTLYTTNLNLSLDANNYSGSGDWQDGTNDNDGVITGATYTNDGNSDYFDFDGNDKITVAGSDLNPANTKTIELWFNPDITDASASRYMISNWSGSGNNYGYHIYIYNNTLMAFMLDQSQSAYFINFQSGGTVTVGKWHHAVLTIGPNASDNKLYLDGELKQTASSTSGTFPTTAAHNGIIIGAYGSSGYYDGKIAQVRAYSTALTEAQINTNYNATKALYQNPTMEMNLLGSAYTSGATWSDSSGKGNNGSISGTPSYDQELGDYLNFSPGQTSGVGTSSTTRLTVSSFSALQTATAFTIEFWLKSSTASSDGMIWNVFDSSSSTRKFSLSWNNSNFRWVVYSASGGYNASQDLFSTNTFSTNTWYHVVATYNYNTEMKIYVDGVLEGAESNPNLGVNTTTTTQMRIGDRSDGYAVDTQVGQARFYTGALTQAQVVQNYLATKNKYPNGINFTGSNISWNANGYFSFNGSNANFATSGAPSALINATGFTVSAWLWRTNSVTGSNTIVGQSHANGNSGQNWILSISGSGTVYFHIYGTDDYAGVSNLVSYETWTHLAGVVEDDGVKRIYKNGVVQLSTASGKSADTVSYDTFVGNLGAINWHDGRIGAVKYYKKPLTADELLADFNATKGTYGL